MATIKYKNLNSKMIKMLKSADPPYEVKKLGGNEFELTCDAFEDNEKDDMMDEVDEVFHQFKNIKESNTQRVLNILTNK